jgi:hypothetical protein
LHLVSKITLIKVRIPPKSRRLFLRDRRTRGWLKSPCFVIKNGKGHHRVIPKSLRTEFQFPIGTEIAGRRESQNRSKITSVQQNENVYDLRCSMTDGEWEERQKTRILVLLGAQLTANCELH